MQDNAPNSTCISSKISVTFVVHDDCVVPDFDIELEVETHNSDEGLETWRQIMLDKQQFVGTLPTLLSQFGAAWIEVAEEVRDFIEPSVVLYEEVDE